MKLFKKKKKKAAEERLELDTESMGRSTGPSGDRVVGLCREESGVDLCVAKKGRISAW